MALFTQHSTYIFDNTFDKRYIPAIYDGEKFRYCYTFIIHNVDAKTTAYVGQGIVGYSIVGMR